VILSSVLSLNAVSAEEKAAQLDPDEKEDLRNLFAFFWDGEEHPKLDRVTEKNVANSFNGRFEYSYIHRFSNEVVRGEFSLEYPRFVWESDGSTGKAIILDGFICLRDETGQVRGFFIGLKNRLYILQLGLPDNRVVLSRKKN
jgi:hypothetical protein